MHYETAISTFELSEGPPAGHVSAFAIPERVIAHRLGGTGAADGERETAFVRPFINRSETIGALFWRGELDDRIGLIIGAGGTSHFINRIPSDEFVVAIGVTDAERGVEEAPASAVIAYQLATISSPPLRRIS